MKGLILGAVAGALAAFYWHDDLMRMRDQTGTTSAASLRGRLADTLESLEASVGEGFDRTRAAACSTLHSWSRTIRGGTHGQSAASPYSESV